MNVYRLFLMMATMSIVGLSALALADTASRTINFTAIFTGGSCDITAPASIRFNNGAPFSSREIEEGAAATTESFELKLTNCAGWGLSPSIKVSGTKTSTFGTALFRNVGGPIDAKGYGILLATDGNGIFNPNPNMAAKGTILTTSASWSSNNQLSEINNMTIPITATLTCGNCDYPLRQGGDFSATVTFDFMYP